jgi:pilus assembly protein Flp/PilA
MALEEVPMQLVQFIRGEEGVTAIEYGLIAALIAVAIIVALTTLGQSLESNFNEVSSSLDGAI